MRSYPLVLDYNPGGSDVPYNVAMLRNSNEWKIYYYFIVNSKREGKKIELCTLSKQGHTQKKDYDV